MSLGNSLFGSFSLSSKEFVLKFPWSFSPKLRLSSFSLTVWGGGGTVRVSGLASFDPSPLSWEYQAPHFPCVWVGSVSEHSHFQGIWSLLGSVGHILHYLSAGTLPMLGSWHERWWLLLPPRFECLLCSGQNMRWPVSRGEGTDSLLTPTLGPPPLLLHPEALIFYSGSSRGNVIIWMCFTTWHPFVQLRTTPGCLQEPHGCRADSGYFR